jgi:hypothetical protein
MALPKPSRGASAAKTRAESRKASLALVVAPVAAPREFHPLTFGDRAAATVHVSAEPVFVRDSVETFEADEFRAYVPDDAAHGNAGNDRAAMRTHLVEAHEWGGNAARVSVLLDDGRSFILEGSWAAIRRAVPDREAVKAWKEAGATEFPLWDFTLTDGWHKVRWVPIDQVPVAVQVEYESRALAR